MYMPLGPSQTLMMAASRALSWSDLPPELLGLVLKRLPSLADRVRVRLVCKPWRSNACLQPRAPPLPWLTLPDGTFLSIARGEIHHMPILDDARCYGSIDNWVFLVHCDGKCTLVNPFSKDTLELPSLAICGREMDAYSEFRPHELCKLVVPSPLRSSSDSLVAIMHADSICICQPPVVTDTIMQPFLYICQLLFFGGKLYALDLCERLFILEIGEGNGSMPKISSIQCIIDASDDLSARPEHLSEDEAYEIKEYLVESAGRLLMVKRWICSMGPYPEPSQRFVGPEPDRTCAFQVFEADLSATPTRWRRVSELGGQSLFIGSHCSKSFPAIECSGVQENCIYYMYDYFRFQPDADPLRDSGVYNITNGEIAPLLGSSTAPINLVGKWRPTWVFPTDAI